MRFPTSPAAAYAGSNRAGEPAGWLHCASRWRPGAAAEAVKSPPLRAGRGSRWIAGGLKQGLRRFAFRHPARTAVLPPIGSTDGRSRAGPPSRPSRCKAEPPCVSKPQPASAGSPAAAGKPGNATGFGSSMVAGAAGACRSGIRQGGSSERAHDSCRAAPSAGVACSSAAGKRKRTLFVPVVCFSPSAPMAPARYPQTAPRSGAVLRPGRGNCSHRSLERGFSCEPAPHRNDSGQIFFNSPRK